MKKKEVSNKDFLLELKKIKSKGFNTNVIAYYENKNIYIEDDFIIYTFGPFFTIVENDFAGNPNSNRGKFDNQIYKITGNTPSFRQGEFINESKENKTMKRLKEYLDYKGKISIEDLMSIMTDEWQFYSKNKLFNESSHYEDEVRDEGRYLEISSILDFATPVSTGYSFSNSRIEKEYNKEINEVYDMTGGDGEEYYNVLFEYEPILLILTVDLKERIIYAHVDLGNGIDEIIAGERLPDDENSFRKTIDKMIDSF